MKPGLGHPGSRRKGLWRKKGLEDLPILGGGASWGQAGSRRHIPKAVRLGWSPGPEKGSQGPAGVGEARKQLSRGFFPSDLLRALNALPGPWGVGRKAAFTELLGQEPSCHPPNTARGGYYHSPFIAREAEARAQVGEETKKAGQRGPSSQIGKSLLDSGPTPSPRASVWELWGGLGSPKGQAGKTIWGMGQ